MEEKQFDCPQCGAQLEYNPTVGTPKCPYCGYEEAVSTNIEEELASVEELNFEEYLENAANNDDELEETVTIECDACYARTTIDPSITSTECPFCGTQIVTQGKSERLIKPKSLLPFVISKDNATQLWISWIQGLWFAPNKLKKNVKNIEKLNGIYIPYWTYDSQTESSYKGERGEYYWEKHDGKKVRKTKWYSRHGNIDAFFDDVLIVATDSVPEKHANNLEPWDLDKIVPYNDSYLSGFRAEAYKKDLKQGFIEAKYIMDAKIRNLVEKDIGGDQQKIHKINTSFNDITFKHTLLPIWISAYRYNDKIYQFLVNGDSGKIAGERPYSWVKIALLVLTIIAIIGGIAAISSK